MYIYTLIHEPHGPYIHKWSMNKLDKLGCATVCSMWNLNIHFDHCIRMPLNIVLSWISSSSNRFENKPKAVTFFIHRVFNSAENSPKSSQKQNKNTKKKEKKIRIQNYIDLEFLCIQRIWIRWLGIVVFFIVNGVKGAFLFLVVL